MELFGYERNNQKKSLVLSEVTMICSKEELEKIDDWTQKDSEFIVFIDHVKRDKN